MPRMRHLSSTRHRSNPIGTVTKLTGAVGRRMAKVTKSDDEWRAELTDREYAIMREAATERAFTGEYWDTKTPGTYRCRGCGAELFDSRTKYDSGSGWPSFTDPVNKEAVKLIEDNSHGMRRTEVRCANCDAHLGHVFPDGPERAGSGRHDRYCINGVCLDLQNE